MRIQHNIMAMNAYRNYNTNTKALSKNLERLSSGYKINRAGDDAAGLAISEKMRAQITGLEAAQKNVKDGTSLVNTAEGAMQEIQDMLNRMVYLATQSSNGTYDNEVDRKNLQAEVDQLRSEIDRIADSANFNGIKLLDGTQEADALPLAMESTTPIESDMIDGSDPTAASPAKVTVKLPANSATTTFTAAKVQDNNNPAEGSKTTVSFTLDGGFSGTSKLFGNAVGGTNADKLLDVAVADGKKIGDLFDVKVGTTDITAANAATTALAGQITLTAKNPGSLGDNVKAKLDALKTNAADNDAVDATADIDITHGTDVGAGGGSAEKLISYTVEIDVTKLQGGQEFQLGGKVFKVNNDPSVTTAPTGVDQLINIYGLDVADISTGGTGGITAGQKGAYDAAAAIVTAFNAAGFTGYTVEAMAAKSIDANGVLTLKITADDATALDLGEFRAIAGKDAAGGEIELLGDVTHQKYEAAVAGDDSGKFAKVSYTAANTDLSALTAGSSITIGGKTINVVASTTAADKMGANDIKEGSITDTALAQLFQKAGFDKGLLEFDLANGKVTITSKDITQNATALQAAITGGVKVTNSSAAEVKVGTLKSDGTLDAVSGGLDAIKLGTTTVAELAADMTAKGLDKLFDVKVYDAAGTEVDSGIIDSEYSIEFTAKMAGQVADATLNKMNFGGSAVKVTGNDEGKSGAGTPTHYEMTFNPAKLAGGQVFTIGNQNGVSYSFELSLDGSASNTDNGTIGSNQQAVVSGDEKTTRVAIDLSSVDVSDSAAVMNAIKDAVANNTKMREYFNVSVKGNTLVLDGKKGADSNLGEVRPSSSNGSISAVKYDPYKESTSSGVGTYAQVSYAFDASKLAAGDTLTIGNTALTVVDKTKPETLKGITADQNTIDISDVKTQGKLEKAFEAAGYTSGQIKIAGGKLTITGIKTGEKAADLANAAGKVSFKTSRVAEGGLTLQIGDTSESFNQLRVAIKDMHTKSLGIDGIDISTPGGAQDAINVIKTAINTVSAVRGDLGAISNRLDHTANNLSVMAENIQDAESAIRDTDIANEMMSYTKNNILVQSAQAMLAQANQVPQGVLQLLQ